MIQNGIRVPEMSEVILTFDEEEKMVLQLAAILSCNPHIALTPTNCIERAINLVEEGKKQIEKGRHDKLDKEHRRRRGY